jgi:hypothetical protein
MREREGGRLACNQAYLWHMKKREITAALHVPASDEDVTVRTGRLKKLSVFLIK